MKWIPAAPQLRAAGFKFMGSDDGLHAVAHGPPRQKREVQEAGLAHGAPKCALPGLGTCRPQSISKRLPECRERRPRDSCLFVPIRGCQCHSWGGDGACRWHCLASHYMDHARFTGLPAIHPFAEPELELIQPHMAQKPVLRGGVGARALRVRSVSREGAWVRAGVQGAWVSGCGCGAD